MTTANGSVRTLLAAASLVAAAAPAVSAHPSYDFGGGCTFAAVTTDERPQPADVPWHVAVVAQVDATDAAGKPAAVPIDVACEVTVGTAAPLTFAAASGVGVAAAAEATTLTFAADVPVTVCDVVTVGGEEHRTCAAATPWGPAQPVEDLVHALLDVMNGIWAVWDPTFCPLLAALAPGVPGVVDVGFDGDVSVVGEGKVWDCPPYDMADEGGSAARRLVRVP